MVGGRAPGSLAAHNRVRGLDWKVPLALLKPHNHAKDCRIDAESKKHPFSLGVSAGGVLGLLGGFLGLTDTPSLLSRLLAILTRNLM